MSKPLKLLLFSCSLLTVFYAGQVLSMPSPRTPAVYYFSQIQKISSTENIATIYRKRSCFTSDKDNCQSDNQSKDIINLGAGYHTDRFTNLPPYSALPILSFSYNPQNWTLKEDKSEVQLLVNNSDSNKQIYLMGDYPYDFAPIANTESENIWIRTPSVAQPGTVDLQPRRLDQLNYQKIGDFIYLFFDNQLATEQASSTNYQFFYSLKPHVFILKAPVINDSDKIEFYNILKTVKYGKQYLGEVVRSDGGWNGSLFFAVADFERRWKSFFSDINCGLEWPDYITIRKVNKCHNYTLAGDVKPNTRTDCNNVFSLQNPNIDIGPVGVDFNTSSFAAGEECQSAFDGLYSGLYKKDVLALNDPLLNKVNTDFIEMLSQCVGSSVDLNNLSGQDVQVFANYTDINVGLTAKDAPKGYAPRFSLDSLDREKFNVADFPTSTDSVGNLTHQFTIYPLMRLYAYKINQPDKYLKNNPTCLNFSSKDHLVYLGYAQDYAILAEFIPDKYAALNSFLADEFYWKLKNLVFYDTGYQPFKNYDPGINHWFKDITTWLPEENYHYVPVGGLLDYFKDYVFYPRPMYALGDDQGFKDFLNLQLDKAPDTGNNLFFVGQNLACEKDNKQLCLDDGKPWDYVNQDSGIVSSRIQAVRFIEKHVAVFISIIWLLSSLVFLIIFYLYFLLAHRLKIGWKSILLLFIIEMLFGLFLYKGTIPIGDWLTNVFRGNIYIEDYGYIGLFSLGLFIEIIAVMETLWKLARFRSLFGVYVVANIMRIAFIVLVFVLLQRFILQ